MPETIDEFLDALPTDQRMALEDLRAKLHAAAPDLTEAIAYGVPALKLNGRQFVSFGAGKDHCAFYVQDVAAVEQLAGEIAAAGLQASGGTIRFSAAARVPADLVQKVVATRRARTPAASA
jgi:uncharacterized protein YdhG (YjbR/CyaY superfamily)